MRTIKKLTLLKGGGYAAQMAALRNFINSTGSLVPSAAGSTPTITLGSTSPTLTGTLISKTDAKIRYIGGHTIENYADIQPGTYPNDQFRTAKNLSFSASERVAIGSIVEFDITCPKFEVLEYGSASSAIRLLVDNQIAGSFTVTADGSLKYRLYDFSAINPGAVQRRIRLEYYGKAGMGGIKLDTTGTLLSLQDTVSYSICWLGDSFVEGPGTGDTTTVHAGVAPYTSKILGFRDYRLSGFGGTGYNVSYYPGFGSTRPSLADRVGWDGISANVYVVAMGINDSDADSGLAAKVASTLNALRTNNPTGLIVVLGPWGNGSGSATKPTVESVVSAACAGRPGVKFISIYDIAFTKSDATHPDAAGHVTLATAIAARIKSWVGAT